VNGPRKTPPGQVLSARAESASSEGLTFARSHLDAAVRATGAKRGTLLMMMADCYDAGRESVPIAATYEEGRAILPSHRPLLLAVECAEVSGTVVRLARRAFDDPGAWGCVLADIVRDVAKSTSGPGLLKHGEPMTAPQRRTAVRMLELFRLELLETEQLDPGGAE